MPEPPIYEQNERLRVQAVEQKTAVRTNGHDRNSPWPEISIVRFADIEARLESRPLIKGVLEHEQLSLVYGETGCGKTFLALSGSIHIADGQDWLGHKVDQGTAVYIAAEAGTSIFNRVTAFKLSGDFGDDIPFFAIPCSLDLCHADAGDLQRLIKVIQDTAGSKIDHITIDTVSRALSGGNENSPDDMGAFVKSMDRLRDEFHAHITGVHHTGKNQALGARGHSLLRAAVDTEIEVNYDEATKNRAATITKQRDGNTGAIIPFRLVPVTIGVNLDGDPVTSCTVEPGDSSLAAKPAKQKKLSAQQGRALQMLSRAIETAGTIPPSNNHIPSSARCVTEALWRQYCVEGGISSGGARAQQIAAQRAAAKAARVIRIFFERALRYPRPQRYRRRNRPQPRPFRKPFGRQDPVNAHSRNVSPLAGPLRQP